MTRPSGNARTWLLSALLLAIAAPLAWRYRYHVLPPPPPPPLPVAVTTGIAFEGATPAMREFLVAAKAADAIADPLARCLAFPDAPGTQWPAGLARAHCEYAFGPHLTFKDMRAFVDRGDVAGLEARLRADLERHFSATGFSEVIHADFESIGGFDGDEDLTRRWLQLAPDSAFALAARGRFLRVLAANARGTDAIGATPPQALRNMADAGAQAITLLQRAIAAEPRLLPAHADLIGVAMMLSEDAVQADAIARAEAVDPGCYPVARARMNALLPQWGGDADARAAYLRELEARVAQRPLLSLALAEDAIAEGDFHYGAGRALESRQVLEPAARRFTNAHVHYDLARAVLATTPAQMREAVAGYVAAMRFESPHGWWAGDLGQYLVLVFNERQWAVSILEHAVARDPDDGWTRMALAEVYWMAQRRDDAEREYAHLMADPELRPKVLLARIRNAGIAGQADRVREYSAQLYRESPELAKENGIGPPVD
jgi:tetratricopeptide (TPR) repeat protein